MVKQNDFCDRLSFNYEKEQLLKNPRILKYIPSAENQEVCLYYEEKLQSELETVTSPRTPIKLPIKKKLASNRASVDLDLTGSPLKAGFDPNEVFDNSVDDLLTIRPKQKKPTHRGFKSGDARLLLSKLNTSEEAKSEDCMNLVLCSYDESLNTTPTFNNLLYLGNRTESGELVEVSKTSWKGPVSYKSLTSSSSYLEEFRQMYMCASGGNRKGGAAGRTIITSTAEFYLTGMEENESHMKLQCRWDKSNLFLESPPPDAQTKLNICLVKGDSRFMCDNQATEIEQLEGLISGLQGAELVWLGRQDQDQTEWTMEQKILEILEISRKNQPQEFDRLQGPSDNLLNVNARQDLDITDMLWKILSQCESYAELTDALHFLFQTIIAEDIRPFVYSGNHSSMAGLLRQCLASGAMPDLSGARPLTLLLEMGIEKLRRDSSHYLLSSDHASKESLDPYLSSNSSLSHSLDMIKRLHLVVEVAFACQTYICLPSASLKTLVHTALARLKQEDFVLEDRVVMEFSLQAADVKTQLETGKASLWSMTYKNDLVTNTAILQVERPEEIYPYPAETKQISDGELLESDDCDIQYYIIYHTSIKQE